MPGLHYTIFTVPKIPCQNFWARISSLETCAIQLGSKDRRRSLCAVSLKKCVSQSTKLNYGHRRVGKNLPARIVYHKKRKKTRKPLMFLAAIDRSVRSLFLIIVRNSFTSPSFQERLRKFGGERAAILK